MQFYFAIFQATAIQYLSMENEVKLDHHFTQRKHELILIFYFYSESKQLRFPNLFAFFRQSGFDEQHVRPRRRRLGRNLEHVADQVQQSDFLLQNFVAAVVKLDLRQRSVAR
jgi:hypothetical protein